MMKKITRAFFVAVLATSFASPVLAQEYTLSPGDAAALSASQGGHAPVAQIGQAAVQKRGVKLYDQAPDVQSQTYWPSSALMGSGR